MKKQYIFPFIIIISFIVFRILRSNINLDDATWDGVSRVVSVMIVISLFSFSKRLGKEHTSDAPKSDVKMQIINEAKDEPSQKINQALYDEDSFKINPEDYKL